MSYVSTSDPDIKGQKQIERSTGKPLEIRHGESVRQAIDRFHRERAEEAQRRRDIEDRERARAEEALRQTQDELAQIEYYRRLYPSPPRRPPPNNPFQRQTPEEQEIADQEYRNARERADALKGMAGSRILRSHGGPIIKPKNRHRIGF
jgi:hypothetical protein